MKKYLKALACLFIPTLLLVACGSSGSLGNKLEMEIVSREFVTPPDKTTRSSKDYIALELKFKNNSKDVIDLFDFNVTLNTDDKSIDPTLVWDATETFKPFTDLSIDAGETKTGYLVYEVNKRVTEYTVKARALSPTAGVDKITTEVKINTEKYEDNREEMISIVKTYINSVFLSSDSATISSSDSESVSFKPGKSTIVSLKTDKDKKEDKKGSSNEIGNDLAEDRDDFLEAFVKNMDTLGMYYYKPSDEEKLALALKYIDENSKRAEVECTIISYLPNVFTVSIKPKVVDLGTLDVYSLIDEYVKSKGGVSFDNYEAQQKDAEKYVFEHLPDKFSTANLSEPSYMPSEGYKLTFVKDEDQWYIDPSDNLNYAYSEIQTAFTGGLN